MHIVRRSLFLRVLHLLGHLKELLLLLRRLEQILVQGMICISVELLRWLVIEARLIRHIRISAKLPVQRIKPLVSNDLLSQIQAIMLLETHSEEHFGVDFALFHLVPDDPIDYISRKIVHSQHFLRTKHRLLVQLLCDVVLQGFFCLMSVTSVH